MSGATCSPGKIPEKELVECLTQEGGGGGEGGGEEEGCNGRACGLPGTVFVLHSPAIYRHSSIAGHPAINVLPIHSIVNQRLSQTFQSVFFLTF